MNTRVGWPAWLGLAVLLGCSLPHEKVWLRIELPAELHARAAALEVKPRIAESSRKLGRGVVALELKRDAGRTRLLLPGACSIVVDASTLPQTPETLALEALFDVGPSERTVGLDQSFEVRAMPRCAEAEPLRAVLSVTGGARLASVVVEQQGRLLRGKTAATLPARAGLHGIVPVSASEHAKLRSELTLRIELPGQEPFERRLGVSAVARSSGLPNIGLSHPVLLSNDGWRLEQVPHGSTAALREAGGLLELTTDQAGVYRLLGEGRAKLSIQSGRYDHTPLDCGRSDCHAAIARSAADSPMTQALASDLGGCHSLDNPECASACHAVGEPGTADGGFSHVARELKLPAIPLAYEELPRALRRLGGVGCAACHGPGAVPEPSGRWAILRSDVCAVCHDAPPRYGHVAALATSRMAHSDHAPETRQGACARCHTTWGALGRPAPEHSGESFGLACAACHDVHPHAEHPGMQAGKVEFGMLRRFPLPRWMSTPPGSYFGQSRVCVSCHSPSSDGQLPEASAAALVAGLGGLDPQTGRAMVLPGPHALDAKGCLSCHSSGPPGLTLGSSHGFDATDAACARCHQTPPGRDPALGKRAQRLLDVLAPQRSLASAEKPWHASTPGATAADTEPERLRAIRNVLLVLEDPAADVHHPAYARALLDAAERLASGALP
ncbi:MAG TPA: hypothetical protein VEX18_04215 [Polyangiaceae bacterium]|nr:hypothetical protein [Polyangiaceae bacterium]